MLFHNPVVLDIIFASLVIFSQGRCIAGFGIGWSKDEFKFPMCHLIIREMGHTNMQRKLKKIWTEENIEFSGEYYNIPQSKIGQNWYKNHTDLFILEDSAQLQ